MLNHSMRLIFGTIISVYRRMLSAELWRFDLSDHRSLAHRLATMFSSKGKARGERDMGVAISFADLQQVPAGMKLKYSLDGTT